MADVAEERYVLYVEVSGEENDGLQFGVGPDGLLIGRSNSCDVIFQNREVSRRHAYFYCDGDRCQVEDLGSKNGLLVNGRRVTKMTLKDGDVVDIGPSRFLIRTDEGARAPAPEAAARGPGQVQESSPQPAAPQRHPLAVSGFVFAVLAYVHWGFGLGAVILALLSLWETRSAPASAGRGLAWAGLALGLVGGLLNGWFTEVAPRVREGRTALVRAECGRNLRDIAVALARYRASHEGREPARLVDLVAEGLLAPAQTRCPGCLMRNADSCDYVYRPALGGAPADSRAVIVCDNSPANHQEAGGWVLRRNGLAQWVQGPPFVRVLSLLKEPPAESPADPPGGPGP